MEKERKIEMLTKFQNMKADWEVSNDQFTRTEKVVKLLGVNNKHFEQLNPRKA